MAYIYDLTDTWNAGGTTFYGIKMNVTNTASAAGSKLLSLQVGGSEQFGVDKNGNVGIGVTSPIAKLDVAGTIRTSAGGTDPGNGAAMYFVGSGAFQTVVAGAEFAVNTGNNNARTERMRITAAGRVGIGTTTPGYALDVVGDFRATTDIVGGATIATGNGISTGDVVIELGGLRTGSGNCYIDLHATNGTDFEARVLRNSGVNGAFDVFNTGTGVFNISQVGAAPLIFKTTDAERMRITAAGNLQLGTASLATNAADGFPYIPTCAGTPTGTPTAITGYAPMVVDSTNNKLYVYVGGAWQAMN